jgi:hypothetical protein
MRKRKNQTHHQKLVSEINRFANDDDDDDEEAIMMKHLIAKQQSAATNNMVKSQLTTIITLLLLLMLALGLLFRTSSSNGEVNRQSSEGGVLDSLSKALSILVGRKKRRERPSLAGAKFIAASTIPKSKFDDLLYYKYNTWSYHAASPIYLIPNTTANTLIRDMLHTSGALRYYGIDIDLYDHQRMYQSLESINREKLNDVTTTENILGSFERLGQNDLLQAQKDLWMWCMLYSGSANGFMDIETYTFQLKSTFVGTLAESFREEGDNVGFMINGPSDRDAIVFVSASGSKVVKTMIEYLINFEGSNVEYRTEYSDHLRLLLGDKQLEEKWMFLNTSCSERALRDETSICFSKGVCCKLHYPDQLT